MAFHVGVDYASKLGGDAHVVIIEQRPRHENRLVFCGPVDIDDEGRWHFPEESAGEKWLRETLDGTPGLRADFHGALGDVLHKNYPEEMALLEERMRKFDAGEAFTPEEDEAWRQAKAKLGGV